MALFLITCVYDEGVYESNFRVVEATSREVIAEYILKNYDSFADNLERSVFYKWLNDNKVGPKDFWEKMNRVILNATDSKNLIDLFKIWFLSLSPKEILEWIDRTSVDGDSEAQLAIYEITKIERFD